MTQLYTKVKLYLEANGKTENEIGSSDTTSRVVLRNEGTLPSEAYIHKWDVSGLVQPTVEQLNSYTSDADTFESNEAVRRTRKADYGDIGEQLDEIYKDIDAWKVRIKKIKDDNPKG
tara:strand:- start:1491 stop:1841 length:351 start_codon:yes stop_codon:yes gene_type:complete